MKKQLLVSAMGLALTATALAQGTTGQTSVSTSSIANTWNALKESPLSLSLYGATDTLRADDNTINGMKNTDIAYLGYKFSDNDSMTIENRYSYAKQQEADAVKSYERINVSYSRKNILTEAKHGVGMKATLDGRYLPEGAQRQATGTYGLGRAGLGFAKSIGPVGLNATTYYAMYNRFDTAPNKGRNYFYQVLTQSYNITDAFSVALTEEIFNNNNEANAGETKNITTTLDLGYTVTPDIAVGVSASGDPILTKDHWDTNPQWTKAMSYGANLSLTVF